MSRTSRTESLSTLILHAHWLLTLERRIRVKILLYVEQWDNQLSWRSLRSVRDGQCSMYGCFSNNVVQTETIYSKLCTLVQNRTIANCVSLAHTRTFVRSVYENVTPHEQVLDSCSDIYDENLIVVLKYSLHTEFITSSAATITTYRDTRCPIQRQWCSYVSAYIFRSTIANCWPCRVSGLRRNA